MRPSRPTYAVIGDPVEHSLSPRLFAHLFAELGIDAHFTALRVTPPELSEALERVRFGALAGLSVTLPHKEAVLPLLDVLHPAAARIGAVNCVTREERLLRGYNTDAEGFRAALLHAGQTLSGCRAVLLGAGGAARAAAFALAIGGAKSLLIANRTPARAVQLGLDLVESGHAWPGGELGRRWEAGERAPDRPFRPRSPAASELEPAGKTFLVAAPLEADALAPALAHADVLINATSAGLRAPGEDPLPAGVALHAGLVVLDMVYRPVRTAFLARAAAAGATTVDGIWMLAFQALEQLRIWTGRSAPEVAAARAHQRLEEES